MIIRKLEVKDIDESLKNQKRIFNLDIDRSLYETQVDRNLLAEFYALEDEGKIIGEISLWVLEPTAEILFFYIIEEKRQQGLGEKLLSYTIESLRVRGINTITLEVRKSNEIAHNLYYKLGFEKVSERKNYYDNGEDADLLIKNM